MISNYSPTTLNELFTSLAKLSNNSKIISGGTDLIIKLNNAITKPDKLLYMGNIADLKKIKQNGNTIEIGASATITSIAESPIIQKKLAALSDAAKEIGSLQIRNNATIGGNVGNASPAGDMIPVLFLFDTTVIIAQSNGILRKARMEEIIPGTGRINLNYNEAIIGFNINLPQASNYKSCFLKIGFRNKVSISRIGFAVYIEFDKDDLIHDAKLFTGAISLKPTQLKEAEKILLNNPLDAKIVKEVGRILSDFIMENTPKEFDRDYKVWAAQGIVEDTMMYLLV